MCRPLSETVAVSIEHAPLAHVDHVIGIVVVDYVVDMGERVIGIVVVVHDQPPSHYADGLTLLEQSTGKHAPAHRRLADAHRIAPVRFLARRRALLLGNGLFCSELFFRNLLLGRRLSGDLSSGERAG